MAARIVDQFRIFNLIRCADLENGLRQHFGESDDRVQGRAELVTYDGHEAAPVRIRPLSFESGRLKRVVLSFSLTNITEDGDNILACFLLPAGLTLNRP